MRIYLVRHAEAEDSSPDAERRLTEKGHEQAQLIGRFFKRTEPKVKVFTSPLARARETAEAIGEPRILDWLADEPNSRNLASAAKELDADGAYAFVGHQPGLGALAGDLCGHPALDLKKGAIVLISFPGQPKAKQGELSLLITPKVLKTLL